MSKCNLGRKGFISYMAGPWRWELKHRLWKSTVYWPVFQLLAQTASLHSWGFAQWWHCPHWAGPSCDQLAVKTCPKLIWWKQFLSWGPLFLDDSSLCKPNQSKHIGCPFPSLSTSFLGGRVSLNLELMFLPRLTTSKPREPLVSASCRWRLQGYRPSVCTQIQGSDSRPHICSASTLNHGGIFPAPDLLFFEMNIFTRWDGRS